MNTYAVMGASGRTGNRLAHRLLDAGHRVRVLGRSASRLDDLSSRGAELALGAADDADYLSQAFRGVDAIYALLPFDPAKPGYLATQRRQGEAMATALRVAGTKRLVFLSSLGADQASGTGMIQPMHDQEARLRTIEGLDITFLRPGDFMENQLGAVPVIRSEGIVVNALDPDLAFPMVATADVADAAFDAMTDPGWHGHLVREVLGPRDITMREVASIIGASIGRPDLPYVQVSYEAMAQALQGAGFDADSAVMTVEISRALNEKRIGSLAGRNPSQAGATPFERFAQIIAAAVAAQ
jgi:uncharacterized protein YbjT (DUF2867 family)